MLPRLSGSQVARYSVYVIRSKLGEYVALSPHGVHEPVDFPCRIVKRGRDANRRTVRDPLPCNGKDLVLSDKQVLHVFGLLERFHPFEAKRGRRSIARRIAGGEDLDAIQIPYALYPVVAQKLESGLFSGDSQPIVKRDGRRYRKDSRKIVSTSIHAGRMSSGGSS